MQIKDQSLPADESAMVLKSDIKLTARYWKSDIKLILKVILKIWYKSKTENKTDIETDIENLIWKIWY